MAGMVIAVYGRARLRVTSTKVWFAARTPTKTMASCTSPGLPVHDLELRARVVHERLLARAVKPATWPGRDASATPGSGSQNR